MNPSFRFALRIAVVLILASGCLPAAPGRLLRSETTRNRHAMEVVVPAGIRTVRMQRWVPGKGWVTHETRHGVTEKLGFPIPKKLRDSRWRAIGIMRAKEPAERKFPAAFYQGENRFGAVKSRGISGFAGDAGARSPGGGDAPAEADIWEVDGDTIYYFNQYRGLQVVDLTNPADPRLTASLAMPAAGEKLYLLPGKGAVRHVVLIAMTKSGKTRLLLVRVEKGSARVVRRETIGGWYEDSRMVGDRLVTATSEWDGKHPRVVVAEWRIAADAAPQRLARRDIPGTNPVISAGNGWLALATNPPDEWNRSEVRVFSLATPGLGDLTPIPVRLGGVAGDSFKIRWADHVLTTISERSWRGGEWNPVTLLETFRVWGPDVIRPAVVEEAPRLGRLVLAEGETLYATRFDGDRAYVVTFLQEDPLWVVDLRDPRKPTVAGHLEVPGWSTHLEPLGDTLFSIGWDDGTVVASLFHVADPAAPKLIRRLPLGPKGTFSEAAWDEMALKVLPEAGLAMVPLSSADPKTGRLRSWVRLLDLDTTAGNIRPRGEIRHAFEPRRAALVGKAIVSISQRVLVTADASDRDRPRVLAEVSLAWPVDRVFQTDGFLIQIEDGNSFDGGTPTARISTAHAPDAILAETDLGRGIVRCAEVRGGKLYLLRDTRTHRFTGTPGLEPDGSRGGFVLDIHDAGALPGLVKLGSCRISVPSDRDVLGGRFHWPRPDLISVIADAGQMIWFSTADGPQPKSGRVPYWRPEKTPLVTTIDVSDPTAPLAGGWTRVGNRGTVPNGVVAAGDGLLAIAAADHRDEKTGSPFPEGAALHTLRIVEVRGIEEPVVRMAIDLPGAAAAVTRLDRDGCLIYCRTDGVSPALTALACDGFDAYQLGSAPIGAYTSVAAVGKSAFVAEGRRLKRLELGNDGALMPTGGIETNVRAYDLRCRRGLVIGTGSGGIFAVSTALENARSWKLPVWPPDSARIEVTGDGGLWVPFGHYGVRKME